MDRTATPVVLEQRLRFRGRLVLVVGASYLVDSALLAGFVALGTIGPGVALFFAGGGALATAFFHAALRSGFSMRVADPYMAVLQAFVGGAITLITIGLAPQLTVYLLSVLFIIFAVLTLRVGLLSAALCWLVLGLASGVVLLLVGDRVSLPAGGGERALMWLAFVLCVGRCNLIAWYGAALRARLRQRNRQLADSVARIARLASRDPLTGVLNRGSLLELLDHELDSGSGQLSIALLDLDHFKSVNDRYGHIVGDRVLERFAQQAMHLLRDGDLIGRYGGEEFVIVFRNAGSDDAEAGVETIRAAIAGGDWSELAPGLTLTVSAGLTERRPGEAATELLQRADAAMYSAKREGRNRTLRFDASHRTVLQPATHH